MMVSKFLRQKLMKIIESFPDITLNNGKQLIFSDIRDVRNSNFYFYSFFCSVFEKGWESVRNEFCSVRFEKTNSVRFGYCSYLLL